jgi:hypothetical protein
MLQFQLVLNLSMRNNQRTDLWNTRKRLKNPILNIYTPSKSWEICLPGEINKSPNPWTNLLIYRPSPIMKRTTKKRRITIYRSMLITIEEKLINTEHAKTSELIGVGLAITDATLDKDNRDEEEIIVVLKELEHLFHLEKYYQDTTQVAVSLRSKFQEAYGKFMDEWHLFTTRIADLQ